MYIYIYTYGYIHMYPVSDTQSRPGLIPDRVSNTWSRPQATASVDVETDAVIQKTINERILAGGGSERCSSSRTAFLLSSTPTMLADYSQDFVKSQFPLKKRQLKKWISREVACVYGFVWELDTNSGSLWGGSRRCWLSRTAFLLSSTPTRCY